MRITTTALIGLLFVSGCASTSSKPSADLNDYTGPAPAMTGTVERAAVCIGVLSAKAFEYGTAPLMCPGADVDASIARNWAAAYGVSNAVTLLSQQAYREGVKRAILAATKGFGPEDMLFLSLSGHGGYVRDSNHDEESGYDSTWCLYDGTWVDDGVWTFIQTIPPCRIFFVTDTCHAEGSWRQYVPFWDTSKPIDMDARGQWAGSIVQFAACRESESSLGNRMGGQWMCALDDALTFSTSKDLTYQQWFDLAKPSVEGHTPTISTYGPHAAEMLGMKVLQ